ncbi:MAG: Flp family type IVb pilin [Candidatus Sedimenticola sp. (ex Thyasira tokunagai)]
MKKLLQILRKYETGATMVEYALMVALIAVVAIAAVTFLGEEVSETFNEVGTTIDATN